MVGRRRRARSQELAAESGAVNESIRVFRASVRYRARRLHRADLDVAEDFLVAAEEEEADEEKEQHRKDGTTGV